MRMINLGAGQYQRLEGYQHQDRIPFKGIDYVFDLNERHWPLQDSTFDKVTAFHVVEHLKDLTNFMDKCHMILKPDGVLEIETPNAGINYDLTHADPTHVRCFRPHSWLNYYSPEGIEKFGYTTKAWNLSVETFQLEVPNDCIRVIATPIK